MFVLAPDPYLLPDYKISPFTTSSIRFNSTLPDDRTIDDYFAARFRGKQFKYTINARSALNKALRHFKLQREDIVTILTTSGNTYVSSCVTGEVEKFCHWNHEINQKTKVILVIHEFGYVHADLKDLRKYKLPIIEDSAYAFFSSDAEGSAHNVGDFVILSFPKMFPIQIGGLLVCNTQADIDDEHWEDQAMLPYIKKVMSPHVRAEAYIRSQRSKNYSYLKARLESFGCTERFEATTLNVPGVFMFRIQDDSVDLKALRDHLFAHGIQCSVFYGERAFFIPVHQDLTEFDLDYFVTVIQSFLK